MVVINQTAHVYMHCCYWFSHYTVKLQFTAAFDFVSQVTHTSLTCLAVKSCSDLREGTRGCEENSWRRRRWIFLLVSSLSGVLELLTGNSFLDNVGNICNQWGLLYTLTHYCKEQSWKRCLPDWPECEKLMVGSSCLVLGFSYFLSHTSILKTKVKLYSQIWRLSLESSW